MSSRSFFRLASATLCLVHAEAASAGLAEATDYNGVWTTGSVPYFGGPSSPDYWVDQATVTIDGVDAAVGRLGGRDAATTWMETSVTGPTTLYFSYRVVDFFSLSSQSSFSVRVNGSITELVTGASEPITTGWTEMALPLPAGDSTVRWSLSETRGDLSGSAYVDQVWTLEDARPRITDASRRTGEFGSAFNWTVPVASATPASLTASGLPPGLTVDESNHVISGSPTAAGEFEATITAINGAGQHVVRVIFAIAPGITSIPEGMDSPSLTFTPIGNSAAWHGVKGLGHDGVDCVRGVAGSGTNDYLTTTVTGPGTLGFWYRTEDWWGHPMTSFSEVMLYVGGSPWLNPNQDVRYQSTGGPDWYHATREIPAGPGPQTIYWRAYALATPEAHYVYLDQASFTPSVIPPQSSFEAWRVAWNVNGLENSNDLDGDGLTLVMEYAFGGSPYVANPELLPVVSIEDGYFTIRVTKAPSPTDLTYLVQASKDLAANSWTTATVEVLDEDATHILARCKRNVVDQPGAHLRVKVLVDP